VIDVRKRILLIDDEPDVRDLALIALEPIRFRVALAAGVPAAIALMKRFTFDLVICSRLDTLASLRSLRRGDDTPVLVLNSGRRWTMTETVIFAPPPAKPDELRELVARVSYEASNVS
jgi:DNA-binding response OmpR family regulator